MTGQNVGSQNSQDEFVGYGTGFNNPDRFKLHMSERIHLISPSAAPFLSWASAVRKKPVDGFSFSWMEDELFTHRDIRAKMFFDHSAQLYTLKIPKGGDWQAFEAAADGDVWDDDKPLVHMIVTSIATPTSKFGVVIKQPALYLGPTSRDYEYTSGNDVRLSSSIVIYDANGTPAIGGDHGEVEAITAGGNHSYGNSLNFAFGEWDGLGTDDTNVDVYVQVITPNEYLGGFAQGSGLPNESRKRSRTFSNFTQIFKTPYSLSDSIMKTAMYGPTELARLRLRKAIEHKVDIERSILFQGGGELNVDYGVLPVSGASNPKTRFKGLGVGVADSLKQGFITTKNGEFNTDFQFAWETADASSINTLCANVFDDTVDVPSSTKVVFASQKWMLALANMAMRQGGTTGQWIFGVVDQTAGTLGMSVKNLTSPVGNLRFVPMPLFRGRYENYALVVDMSNIEIRPVSGRDTTLHADVGPRDLDGKLDYYMTDLGLEVHHESTHAILKLT